MIELDKPLSEQPSIDELLDRYRAITIERAAMRKLKEHPGWKPYLAIIKGNVQNIRRGVNNQVIQSMDHALHLNFENGKAFALQMMIDLIEAVDPAYERELQILEVQIEEKRNAKRPAAPGDESDTGFAEPEPELPLGGTQPDQLAP